MSTYATPIQVKSATRNYTEEQKKKFKVDLKKCYEEEKKMVKGRFMCFEPPGGAVSFCFRKYEWDHPVQYNLHDGEEYEIPLAVARHLNGIDITAKKVNGNIHSCSYPIHNYKTNEVGATSIDVGKRIRRYAFQTISGETFG